MDNLPAPIGFVDRNLRVRCVNQAACRFYGYGHPREVLGRTVAEVVGPVTYARVRPKVEAALSGETVVFDDVAPDWYGPGSEYASEEHLIPRFGPNGGVVGCDFLAIDVTARRRAELAQRALSRKLLLSHEEERRAVAHELHEGISQALTGLNLWLATEAGRDPHVAGAQRLVAGLTERARRLAVDLRPPELEDFNLLLVLRGYLRRFEQQTGIRVQLHVQLHAEGGGYYLPDPVQTAAFRIVEEALINVARHAGVDSADVHLIANGAVLTVTVRDAGQGFQNAAAPHGVGMDKMRTWAELLGGTVAVEAAPGAGVVVTATLPVV